MAASTSAFGALLRSVEKIVSLCQSKKEKAPPGDEHVVKALKKKGNIDNPWAVAWSMHNKQSEPAKRSKFQESSRLSEVVNDSKLEGRIIDVVLVTEGLGNKRDMNYYGPEAMKSGIEAFEGAGCFLNHPTESDMKDIPERRAEDKCGYFKNLRLDKVKDFESNNIVNALVGEVHLDQSPSGDMAFGKIKTAIHYRSEFPGSSTEYVGLSVNADGEAEERTMTIAGAEESVNYVTAFIKSPHTSCDLVTSPARGGRFLATVKESIANTKFTKEAQVNKLIKKFKSALATLKAVESETDAALKSKRLAEAHKAIEAAEEEAKEADILGIEAFAPQEGEAPEDHKARLGKLAAALKKEMEAYESEDEASEADDDEPADKPADKADKKDMESARAAVKHLLVEAKIPVGLYDKTDIEELARMPFQKAKARIARDSRFFEASAKKAAERMMGPSTFVLKEGDGEGERTASGNAAFKEAFRGGR